MRPAARPVRSSKMRRLRQFAMFHTTSSRGGCENAIVRRQIAPRSTAAQKATRGSRSSRGSWISGSTRSVNAVKRVRNCGGLVPATGT